MDGEAISESGHQSDKGVWNSLERWKLGVAAATPVLLFALGAYVTDRAGEREKRYKEDQQNIAITRDRQLRREAAARDEQIRKEAADRDAQIRQEAAERETRQAVEAFEREKALRREGYERDAALRREAFAREEASRREAINVASYAALIQQRIELWERLHPKINYLMSRMLRTGPDEPDYDAREFDVTTDEAGEIAEAYQTYFSPAFIEAFERFSGAATRYWRARRALPHSLPLSQIRSRLTNEIGEAHGAHRRLREVVARELAIITGNASPAPPNAPP
jgi:hypothetical protein